jgi:purine-binding chemotaxis protein CheW
MSETKTAAAAASTQWVVFTVGDERFGVNATQVQEIVRFPEATLVPDMPSFVKGVMNLRGKIIPLMDVQERFGITGVKVDVVHRRVVVAMFGDQLVGLVVHSVIGVMRIAKELIEPLPPTLPKVESEYIIGVGKVGDHLVVLLGLERMLGDMEKIILSQLTARAEGGAKT